MDLATLLVLSWLILAVTSVLHGVFLRKRQARLRRERLRQLQQAVALQKRYILNREGFLNRYDFLRYNLDEALVPQYEIKL